MLWDALPDALHLARFQFAFTVVFHFLFPAFTIGLASYLAVLEGLWLRTGRRVYLDLFRYWLKIFAVAFAMGVVSGIVHVLPVRHELVGLRRQGRRRCIGPLLGYEVLTAFFLEAGFLGVMLFGLERVGQGAALPGDLPGRGRHADLGLLDPVGEFLDADAGGLLASAPDGRFMPDGLVGDRLQPVLPLPLRPHGHRPPTSPPR